MNKQELLLVNTVNQLTTVNPKKAGKAIEDYASAHGDSVLITLLPEMNILDLVKIIREYDYTSPSILTWLMTPEHILSIVKATPLFWEGEIKNNTLKLQLEVIDFLYYLLKNQDNKERKQKIIETLIDDESGKFFLSIPFYGFFDSHYSSMISEIREEINNVSNHLNEMDFDASWVNVVNNFAILIERAQQDIYTPKTETQSMFTKI